MRNEMRIRAVDRHDARSRTYLGDGVYVAWDGFGLWLTAEDGREATDVIYLEPTVWQSLRDFVLAIHRAHTENQPAEPEHLDERGSEPA